jgi:hypothetical protein
MFIARYLNAGHNPSISCCTALGDLGRFFQFLNLNTVGRTPRTRDQPVARPLHTHRTTQTRVGFEPTILVLERAKTVDALDCAAAVIGVQDIIAAYKWLIDPFGPRHSSSG